MSKLKKLTDKQLNKMVLDTQAELKRREDVSIAAKEISAVLKRYSITIDDIDLDTLRPKALGSSNGKSEAGRKVEAKTINDNRKTVAPKYESLDGNESWTGRGRAPKWVMIECEKKGINLDAFKKDKRFIIDKTK